jgi:hypothetical protein
VPLGIFSGSEGFEGGEVVLDGSWQVKI